MNEKQRMAWQAEFLNRPEISAEILQAAHRNGLTRVVHSFNLLGMPDEVSCVLRSDEGLQFLRLNPEVTFQLAMALIQISNQLGWTTIEVDRKDLTQGH